MWREAFLVPKEGPIMENARPVCGHRTLRRYYHLGQRQMSTFDGREYKGRGALWLWCGTCWCSSTPRRWCWSGGGESFEVDIRKMTPYPNELELLVTAGPTDTSREDLVRLHHDHVAMLRKASEADIHVVTLLAKRRAWRMRVLAHEVRQSLLTVAAHIEGFPRYSEWS